MKIIVYHSGFNAEMCLDVNHMYNNQVSMKERDDEVKMDEYQIKRLCGGSLIEHAPVFDPKGG